MLAVAVLLLELLAAVFTFEFRVRCLFVRVHVGLQPVLLQETFATQFAHFFPRVTNYSSFLEVDSSNMGLLRSLAEKFLFTKVALDCWIDAVRFEVMLKSTVSFPNFATDIALYSSAVRHVLVFDVDLHN